MILLGKSDRLPLLESPVWLCKKHCMRSGVSVEAHFLLMGLHNIAGKNVTDYMVLLQKTELKTTAANNS